MKSSRSLAPVGWARCIAERLARFQREAELLATLNHPNIAQIHGLEDRALVLELVEGPTLADRIAQGPIPLDEALPIARQIADALEAAHERGIVPVVQSTDRRARFCGGSRFRVVAAIWTRFAGASAVRTHVRIVTNGPVSAHISVSGLQQR
jgi:hypothetical protein